MGGIFYEWYSPLTKELNGIICIKCAKREAGYRYWEKINESKNI